MAIKLTSFFEGFSGSRPIGWSESIVADTDSFTEAKTKLLAPANSYILARCLCLGAGVENVFNRLTKLVAGPVPVNPPRRITQPAPGLTPGKTSGGLTCYGDRTKAKLADFSQNVFMMRFTTDIASVPVYNRTLWLAGIPDVGTDINNSRPLAGDWLTAIEAYQTFITTAPGGFCIQVEDRSDANPARDVDTYDFATNTYTVPGHTFVKNQKIVATGFRGIAGAVLPKGLYRIASVAGNNIVLKNAKPMSGETKLGNFRALAYAFPLIKSMAERGWTNKKKGRVFGQLVGRRSAPRTSRS